MPTNNRALKVFLCHANEDKSKVRKLHRFLVSNGIDAWLDEENLLIGQEWRIVIPKAVRDADVVVVCMSSVSARKEGFVQAEINFALDKAMEKPEGAIYIIPAKLEECAIPDKLSRWQRVDLYKKNGYRKLLDTLSFCAREIDVTIPQISVQGNSEVVQRKVAKNPKRNLRSQKNSDEAQARNLLKIEGGIIVVGNVIDSSLISGNENLVAASRRSDDDTGTNKDVSTRSEKFVSDRVLTSWLNKHGLAENPFGKVDLKSHPYYPEGATRPNQWEAFLDPDPLLGFCPTSEDAQVLSFRLRLECLPLKNENLAGGINHRIFPLLVSHRQTTPIQSPLLTFVQSAAQTWLDILLQNPSQLFELPPAKQDALLDMLHWAYGSINEVIGLLQFNGLEEDATGLSLIRKIEKSKKEFSTPSVPQDPVLLSWLNIRPRDLNKTFLIFPGDDLFLITPKWWFEQFNSSIPQLLPNGIVTKVIASTSAQISLPFQKIELAWSDGLDGWLYRSLQGQFDAAMTSEEKSMGIAIRFHELFGPGATEEITTAKLISASSNSLARMLTHGNRLLQYHCGKYGASEKYLYPADLEYILKTV